MTSGGLEDRRRRLKWMMLQKRVAAVVTPDSTAEDFHPGDLKIVAICSVLSFCPSTFEFVIMELCFFKWLSFLNGKCWILLKVYTLVVLFQAH